MRAVIGPAALIRLAAWTCVVLLAILSLLPADEIVRTGFGGHLEHATAYAVTAALLRRGYPDERLDKQILLLIAYAAALEYLQNFSPGRTPALEDWLFSSLGALVGSGVRRWLAQATPRLTRKPPSPESDG